MSGPSQSHKNYKGSGMGEISRRVRISTKIGSGRVEIEIGMAIPTFEKIGSRSGWPSRLLKRSGSRSGWPSRLLKDRDWDRDKSGLTEMAQNRDKSRQIGSKSGQNQAKSMPIPTYLKLPWRWCKLG